MAAITKLLMPLFLLKLVTVILAILHIHTIQGA